MSDAQRRILYIKRMFEEETNDGHGMSMQQIQDYLWRKYQLKVDARTIRSDIIELEMAEDIEIQRPSGRDIEYRLLDGHTNEISTTEMSVIVDALQSSHAISEEITSRLIGKLLSYCKDPDTKALSEEIVLSGKKKTKNDKVLYNLSYIRQAIAQDNQIRFKYINYNRHKEPEYKHDGSDYIVNPFKIVYNNEFYYLLAIAIREKKVRAYRIDRMDKLTIEPKSRRAKETFEKFSMENIEHNVFNMYLGKPVNVTMVVHKSMMNVVLDKFGFDVEVLPVKKRIYGQIPMIEHAEQDKFQITVPIMESPQFYSWLVGLGEFVEIMAPREVRERFVHYVIDSLHTHYAGGMRYRMDAIDNHRYPFDK